MKTTLLTTAIAAAGLALCATSANAAMTTDAQGNVGYDSYDECVSAVKAGNTKFYTPYTYEEPKLGRGETSVTKARLSDVTIPSSTAANMPLQTRDYSAGACDLGVGHSNGRSGVSGVLVGKYVPFSADMPVNVYMNSNGQPVRVTMQQCDNHFSSRFPIPVPSEAPALPAQLVIDEEVTTDVVETITYRQPVARSVQPVIVQPGGYEVKEVIVAPASQVRRVATPQGTQVVIQNAPNQAVIVGEEANRAILEQVPKPVQVPVIEVPAIDIDTPAIERNTIR